MSNPVIKDRPGSGWSMFVSIAGLVVLSFVVGTAVVEFEWFPYPQFLKQAYSSLRFQVGRRDTDWTEDGRFRPCRTTETGVTKQTSEAFPGYTLYTTCGGNRATLVDMQGQEVHRWEMPFHSVWPDPKHIKEQVSAEFFYSEHAHLYPNGDLLLNYQANEVTPYGFGLAKMDKNSKLLWSYPGRAHHQVEVAEDGTIYALTHDYRHLTDADRPPQLTTDIILEDFVVAISPTGQELWKISLFDAAQRSPEYRPLAIAYNGWDLMHANAVRVIPEDFAKHHNFCRAGQLLVSLRNPDTLAVLDIEQQRIVWAARGFWRQQHSPIFVKGGRLMLFDNFGFASRGESVATSRVAEFNPSTNEMFWDYHGSPESPFFSRFRGNQQILPNGNVLINESDGGRIFEVTTDQHIVWEFYSPERLQYEGQDCVWCTSFASRFGLDECKFLPTVAGK